MLPRRLGPGHAAPTATDHEHCQSTLHNFFMFALRESFSTGRAGTGVTRTPLMGLVIWHFIYSAASGAFTRVKPVGAFSVSSCKMLTGNRIIGMNRFNLMTHRNFTFPTLISLPATLSHKTTHKLIHRPPHRATSRLSHYSNI